VTTGLVFIAELTVLAYWGLVTPGQVIPTWEGAVIVFGTAAAVSVVCLLLFRVFGETRGPEALA